MVLSVVKFSDIDGETGTRGSLYKFAMLNSPEISHLGKIHISPKTNYSLTYGVGKKIDQDITGQSFRPLGA